MGDEAVEQRGGGRGSGDVGVGHDRPAHGAQVEPSVAAGVDWGEEDGGAEVGGDERSGARGGAGGPETRAEREKVESEQREDDTDASPGAWAAVTPAAAAAAAPSGAAPSFDDPPMREEGCTYRVPRFCW